MKPYRWAWTIGRLGAAGLGIGNGAPRNLVYEVLFVICRDQQLSRQAVRSR